MTLGLIWSCFIASNMGDIAAKEASEAGALKEERPEGRDIAGGRIGDDGKRDVAVGSLQKGYSRVAFL